MKNQILAEWVLLLNEGNVDKLSELYHTDATIHHTIYSPLVGKVNIKKC